METKPIFVVYIHPEDIRRHYERIQPLQLKLPDYHVIIAPLPDNTKVRIRFECYNPQFLSKKKQNDIYIIVKQILKNQNEKRN